MFVSIIGGSDKMTVSVATGHQVFYLHYVSPSNITNVTRRGHRLGVLPCAFLPISKSKYFTKGWRLVRANTAAQCSYKVSAQKADLSTILPTAISCMPQGHL